MSLFGLRTWPAGSRFRRGAVLGLVLVAGVGSVALSVLRDQRTHRLQLANEAFAPTVFQDVPYQRVLASRRLVAAFENDKPWTWCGYAVVELATDASGTPPEIPEWRGQGSSRDSWRPTPGVFDRGETAYRHWCEPNFSSQLFKRMVDAMTTRGSWYVEGRRGLFVYAPGHGIAYHLTSTL